MKMKMIVALLSLLFVSLAGLNAHASKGDLAVRTDIHGLKGADADTPFGTTAIMEGRCREVDVPKADSRKIMWLYREFDSPTEKEKIIRIGLLYYNEKGQECVCLDDRAVSLLLLNNVCGDMVSISGWKTAGKTYNLDYDNVIVVNSMELLGDLKDVTE